MKKYNVRSADVLNSADAFMNKLNWSLFAEEQDQLLFGYNEDVEWVPGSPVHRDPRSQPNYNMGVNFFRGFDGNYVRPLYELFDDLVEFYKKHFAMRCGPCGVDWIGDAPCWVCGEERLVWADRVPLDFVPLTPRDFDGETVIAGRQWRNTADSLDLARSLRTVVNTPRQNRRSELMQWLIDEMADVLEVPRELITPPEPVVMFGVELPADWATRRPDVPLPDTPEPRDFSDWVGGENFWIREDRRWR